MVVGKWFATGINTSNNLIDDVSPAGKFAKILRNHRCTTLFHFLTFFFCCCCCYFSFRRENETGKKNGKISLVGSRTRRTEERERGKRIVLECGALQRRRPRRWRRFGQKWLHGDKQTGCVAAAGSQKLLPALGWNTTERGTALARGDSPE